MAKRLDARGLHCPAPVLLAKDTLEREDLNALEIMVDNESSRENVTRFLASRGFSVTDIQEGADFLLRAERAAGTGEAKLPESSARVLPSTAAKTLVLIGSDRLGSGDDELGRKLMISYIKTLKEMGDELWQLIFVNNGVKLTIEQSAVLPELQEYERSGITILACGTCLNHFGLNDAKRVGQTTNMLDIVTAMQLADKVITLG